MRILFCTAIYQYFTDNPQGKRAKQIFWKGEKLMRKLWKKVLSSVLCLAMLLSFLSFGAVNAFGVSASIDYGKNPTRFYSGRLSGYL